MTDKEKAHYYDEWYEYFEPLARIRKEVKKSVREWERVLEGSGWDNDELTRLVTHDVEVMPEIKNLIRTMLIEIEEIDD